jgi:hypothetical protein
MPQNGRLQGEVQDTFFRPAQGPLVHCVPRGVPISVVFQLVALEQSDIPIFQILHVSGLFPRDRRHNMINSHLFLWGKTRYGCHVLLDLIILFAEVLLLLPDPVSEAHAIIFKVLQPLNRHVDAMSNDLRAVVIQVHVPRTVNRKLVRRFLKVREVLIFNWLLSKLRIAHHESVADPRRVINR